MTSCQKFPLTEAIPARSKMDSLLVKAELISDCGSAAVITHLRREKKLLQPEKREVRICERNSSVDTKVSGEGAPGVRAEISLQPVVKTTMKQAVPCSPSGKRDPHAA